MLSCQTRKTYVQADRSTYRSNETERYVVKEIPQDFNIREDIYQRIGYLPHVRTPSDSLPTRRMFIFPYLNENLLQLVQKDLPLPFLKSVLKRALQGLAMLHERDIVHNGNILRFVSHVDVAHFALDVKPDNILIQVEQTEAGPEIGEVSLADLEDSAHVPPGRVLKGAQLGNWMWRSPESHAMGPIEKPSDMFSFGIVVSSFQRSFGAELIYLCKVYIRHDTGHNFFSKRTGTAGRSGQVGRCARAPSILFRGRRRFQWLLELHRHR